jgi:hypothetical protein
MRTLMEGKNHFITVTYHRMPCGIARIETHLLSAARATQLATVGSFSRIVASSTDLQMSGIEETDISITSDRRRFDNPPTELVNNKECKGKMAHTLRHNLNLSSKEA